MEWGCEAWWAGWCCGWAAGCEGFTEDEEDDEGSRRMEDEEGKKSEEPWRVPAAPKPALALLSFC